MKPRYAYGVMSGKKEAAGFARVLAHSFGRKEEESATWLSRYPHDVVRVLRDARGNIAAGTILISMGQFFGGKRVAMVGIQGVGVAPEARGHGAATELMRRVIGELAADRTPISTLYPATQALYRRVGYEQAGHRFEFKLPLALIDERERGLDVMPLTESDRDEVRAVYRAFAGEQEGTLDRTDPIWHRIEFPPPTRDVAARGFKVVASGTGGAIEGYVYLAQQPVEGGRHDVHVHDMAALTERAGRRLWSFLGSYSTIANDLHWYCGPGHPMLGLLAEQPFKLGFMHYWMVRICDVKGALEGRGYAEGLTAKLTIDVDDPLVRANHGLWRISVAGGRAAVSRIKQRKPDLVPKIGVGIRALAPLFSGFYSAAQLRRLGWLTGDDASARVADGLFALRTASMSDMF